MNEDKVTDTLVARYVEADPTRPGVDEARLIGFGIPVWAVVGHFNAVGSSVRQVAEDYDLPIEVVQAALAYYAQHREALDSRIAANAA